MSKTFSQAFNDHLSEANVKITEVARGSGVTKEALYSLKYGKTRNMSVDDAIKVAAYFGETVEEFMGQKPRRLRDALLDQIQQLSERERRILEVSLKAVLAEREVDVESSEPESPGEEDL